MVDHDRLSTTFRFRTASSKLDERGRADMQRLVTYLEQQPAGTEVLFVGFTDDVGPFDNNLALARMMRLMRFGPQRATAPAIWPSVRWALVKSRHRGVT